MRARRVLRNGYSSGYLSINTILAGDIQVGCRVLKTIPRFGFVAPEYFSEDLEPGSEVKLPLWVAEALCRPSAPNEPFEPNYITILDSPTFFKDALWEVLEDDPKTTDLRRFHNQYFEAGLQCSTVCHKEAGNLAEMMFEMLKQRVLAIGEKTIDDPDHLEEIELKLADDWNENLGMLDEFLLPFTNADEAIQDQLSPEDLLEMMQTEPLTFPEMMQIEPLTLPELGDFAFANHSVPIEAGGDASEGEAGGQTCATNINNNDSTLISFPKTESPDPGEDYFDDLLDL